MFKPTPLFAALLLLIGASGSLNAASSLTTTIYDSANDSTPKSGGKYEIYSMDVTWDSSDNVMVDVYTNFAGVAGTSGAVANRWYIRYGDLLIGTNPSFNGSGQDTGTTWDYAFMLDQDDVNGYKRRSPLADTPQDGYLVEFNGDSGKNTAWDWHHSRDGSSQAGNPSALVTSGYDANVNPVLDTGTWGVTAGTPGVVSFSFNIASLGLQDPAQLAFRWAMTCANDIISGVAHRPTNEVAEPALATLLISGLGLVGFSRRRRQKTAIHS